MLLAVFPAFGASARFSLSHGGLDGGGGASYAGRFTADSSMDMIHGSSQSSDGSLTLAEGRISLLNDPPSPEKDFIELPATGPVNIPVANLLANDADIEGNPSTLSLVETNTTHGGTVRLSNGVITYTPPAIPDPRGDSFSYVLTDGFGGASIGKVVLSPGASVPRLLEFQGNNRSLLMRLRGLPDTSYMLQFREAFASHSFWRDYPDSVQPLLQTADENGSFDFSIPTGSSHGFFRVADVESLRGELHTRLTGSQLSMTLRGIPNTVYKVQFRARLDPAAPWLDYPSASHPFTTRSASDGLYRVATPIAGSIGFFRAVPRDE